MICHILVCYCAAVITSATPVPDPYVRSDQPTIGPRPVPVMEQVFWVQLKLDPATEVRVAAPDGVRLLDRTKPGQGRRWTRFYFRAERGRPRAVIRFSPGNAPDIALPVRVLSYREDIENQTLALPGIDPQARKQGRSFFTAGRLAIAQENLRNWPQLRKEVEARNPYRSMSDEELWQVLPPWSVPRQTYGNWPCPKCGDAVFERNAFYPWIWDGKFKCRCPICKTSYPSNDYANDDFTSGEYPDDGWGWDPGTGKREDFHGWIGYYNGHRLWHYAGHRAYPLALRYLLLGDKDAAHRAALLLCRVACSYPGMSMKWQQVLPRYLRVGKIEIDGNWDRRGTIIPFAKIYDAIFDYLDEDKKLVEFLHAKDPAIQSADDVRALIDVHLLQNFGVNMLQRNYTGGDDGIWESQLAMVAVCANMGRVSDRWIQEIFEHGYNSGANCGGVDDAVLTNYLTREGVSWIGAMGYGAGKLSGQSDLAEILSLVKSPRWRARCNLYDAARYPRFRAAFDAFPRMQVAGQFFPAYGDSGSIRGDCASVDHTHVYARSFARWQDLDLARHLHRWGRKSPPLFERDVWPQAEAMARAAAPVRPLGSRAMDGVGFVFLESRPDASDLRDRAGAAIRYGYGWGHSHHDNLNVELFARGESVVPELGYPCWAHPQGATQGVVHHVTGMIDRRPQHAGSTSRGALEVFASAPEASFAEISAMPSGFRANVYRRACALLDLPHGSAYFLDVFRLAGGKARTFNFHGPPYADFRSNVEFGPKEDQPYMGNVIEPQRAVSDGDVWAEWKCQFSPKDKRRRDLWMRLALLGETGRRYVTAGFAKPDAPPTRFLFAEDEGADGLSQFVSLWEAHEGTPQIENVERLPIEPSVDEHGFAPVAARVTLLGGQTDTIFYSMSPDTPYRCGDFEFRGSFGYYSEGPGELRCLHLVNGGHLLKRGNGVRIPEPAFRAKITKVDYPTRKIWLDRSLPSGADVTGCQLMIAAGPHRTSYVIERVLPPGNVVALNLSAIIFRSRIESFDERESCLHCEIAPPVEATRGFAPGYYNGALLADESLSARYRVVKVGDGTRGPGAKRVFVTPRLSTADFADTDGDGRKMVAIYDYGEGHDVLLHHSAFVRMEGDGRLTVITTGESRNALQQ